MIKSNIDLRDFFAAAALQGFLSHKNMDYAPLHTENTPMVARESYLLADAMLAAREESKNDI